MTDQHKFLFTPGRWLGSGKITFSASQEHVRFYTSWQITQGPDGILLCTQRVELQEPQEVVINHYVISEPTENAFRIDLENELFGKVQGKGVIDKSTIAWEFHGSGSNGCEGFEVYELQENGDYMLHAEYSSADLFRTIIDARIWKKASD